MIRADIETEVSPIVGTEKQSEELVHYLLNEFETDPKKIWESNLFGKSLHELVNEGLHNKLRRSLCVSTASGNPKQKFWLSLLIPKLFPYPLGKAKAV